MTDHNQKTLDGFIANSSNTGNCAADLDKIFFSIDKYSDNGRKTATLISLQKTLQSLSPQKKTELVCNSLSTLLASLLPLLLVSDYQLRDVTINIVDDILPDFLKLNYSTHAKWTSFLEKLNENKSFIDDMCRMIQENDAHWSSLWKILVKLIGTQLHRKGNLINSLLHVLESAFRAPNDNRAKAFQCWNVLIENFAMNPEKMLSYSRIKLLCVPLSLNNVKSEEIAITKHNTWWFLVRTVQQNAPIHWKSVLLQYLKFCFGEPGVETSPSSITYPGLVYPNVQKDAVMSLVEIMGHRQECNGECVGQLERLSGPIINLEAFKSIHPNLFYCMKIAVPVMSHDNANCLWSSCVSLTVKYIHENQCIIKTILTIVKFWIDAKCSDDPKLSRLVMKVILPKLFVPTIYDCTEILDNTYSETNIITIPFQALATMMCSSALNHNSLADEKSSLMKHFIRSGLSQCRDVNNFCLKLVNNWNDQENHCIFWKCLAEEIVTMSNTSLSHEVYKNVLRWPFKSGLNYDKASNLSPSWQSLYGYTKKIIQDDPLENMGCTTLEDYKEQMTQPSSILIFLCAALKQCLRDYTGGSLKPFKVPLETIRHFVSHINDKNIMADLGIPIILNMSSVVGSVISNITSGRRTEPVYLHLLQQLAKSIMFVSTGVFHKIELLKSHEKDIVTFLSNTHNFLLPAFCQQTSHHIIDALSLFLNKCDNSSTVSSKSIQILKMLQCNENLSKEDIISVKKLLQDRQKNFTSPAPVKPSPEIRKKTPLKRTDSEEFVVIQPCWKFDPKKLTEHQAEMMKRRREDIPAMYEDLSQSQDSNIKAWKPPGYKSDSSHGDTNFSQFSESISNEIDKNNKENANEIPKELKDDDNVSPTMNAGKETPKRDKSKLSIRSKITNSLKKLHPMAADAQEKPETAEDVTVSSPMSDVDRPSRVKRKPVKFSPDIDKGKSVKKHQENNEESENVTKTPSTLPSPRSTKRKSRLLKQLSIDTVEGHPSKELKIDNDLNARSTRKRKLDNSNLSEDTECPKSKEMKKSAELNDNEEYNELKEVEMFLEQTQKDQVSSSSNSQESEDIIASSQDSTFSTCSIKTPRRITSMGKYKQQRVINPPESAKQQTPQPELDIPILIIEKNGNRESEPLQNDVNTIKSEPTSLSEPTSSENNSEDKETEELSSQEIREADTEVVVASPNTEKEEKPVNVTPEKKICLNTSIVSSPYHENIHEKTMELLNNTIDISPIKTSAPISDPDPEIISSPDKPDTSANEPAIIASPVKESTSPELFCSEKLSSPKQNIQNSSPPRSRSVKSNPNLSKMKGKGRGAHMIGLCLLETESIKHSGVEDTKEKPSETVVMSPVCKNLQNIYIAAENEKMEIDDDEPILEFNKILPSPFASPAVPILKKLDDSHLSSPTSKKKRVSFHDPPVSTTMNIQKYIEPECNIRSPQQVTIKNFRNRINKPMAAKSLIKKMECEAQLEEVVTPLIENDSIVIDSPQILSITKNCLLNDEEPIYPQLCQSKVSIKEIATELSSPMLKDLFLKQIDVKTIGDLASMTELQINRLPIKSPKVATVKKVLGTYEGKDQIKTNKIMEPTVPEMKDSFTECEVKTYAESGNQTQEQLPKSFVDCLLMYKNQKNLDDMERDMKRFFNSSDNSHSEKIEESQNVLKVFAKTCPTEYMDVATSAISSCSILDKLSISDILKYVDSKMKGCENVRSKARNVLVDLEKEITEEIKEKYSAKAKQLISIQHKLDEFIAEFHS